MNATELKKIGIEAFDIIDNDFITKRKSTIAGVPRNNWRSYFHIPPTVDRDLHKWLDDPHIDHMTISDPREWSDNPRTNRWSPYFYTLTVDSDSRKWSGDPKVDSDSRKWSGYPTMDAKLSSYISKWRSRLTVGSKGFYVSKLLKLSGSPFEEILKACLSKVSKSLPKIGKTPEMMVEDGCFILGFLYSEKEQINGKKEEIGWVTENTLIDMLRVERQIPFIALKRIFECTVLKSNPNSSLTDLMKPLLEFGHCCLFKGDLRVPDNLADISDHDHILGLLHKCYQPKPPYPVVSSEASKICNAMELEKAGVSFRPIEDASWPMAIEIKYSRGFLWFWVKPAVEIPKLNIHARTEVFLQNIIEYERNSKVDRYFTSFMAAIDDIVDSGHDIATLVASKVIINGLESNEEAANMIKKIGKNALICSFYSKQWKELNAYCNQYPTLVRRKWNSLNLLAGIMSVLFNKAYVPLS